MARILMYVLTVVMFQIVFINASASENTSFAFAGLRTHYGFIIPHSEKIRSISKSNPRGLELNAGWHLAGDNAWKYCFCYPRAGLMITWFDYDNPEILGNALIVAPYIEPFFSSGKLLSASVKTGIGLAYLDNIYDPEANPLNHFYSTHLSFLIFLNFNLNYRLNAQTSLTLGANYNHISNGGNRQPNKGINFPTASLGVDYYFSDTRFPERSREEYHTGEGKTSFYRMSVFFTSKEISKEDGKQYPVFGFSPKYSHLLGRLSAISGGFEIVSDGSLKERITQENPTNSDHKRISLFAGHELLIGRFNFYQELGVYLYSPYKAMDPVYQRYGLEYSIFSSLAAGASLKSHRHVADFLDIRVSYTF